MIAQIDLSTNKVVYKWESVEKIKQHTSYSAEDIKKAIDDKKPYGGYVWLNYCKK